MSVFFSFTLPSIFISVVSYPLLKVNKLHLKDQIDANQSKIEAIFSRNLITLLNHIRINRIQP